MHHRCEPTWRFHTGLCKFLRNISTNIWSLGKCTGLKLGEVSSLFIYYNFLVSWLFTFSTRWFFFHCVTVKTICKLRCLSADSISSEKWTVFREQTVAQGKLCAYFLAKQRILCFLSFKYFLQHVQFWTLGNILRYSPVLAREYLAMWHI